MQKFNILSSRSLHIPMLAAGLLLPFSLGQARAEDGKGGISSKGISAVKSWFGKASWYGIRCRGKHTASGEAFDGTALTAAHRTLPFGSMVRVTNLTNHKSVVVKINDRGPYVGNRMLDLSQAAARMLGFSGTATVKMELVPPQSTVDQTAALWQLQPAFAQ